MKICTECGRVNPNEAQYCMTCASNLRPAREHEERRWTGGSHGSSSARWERREDAEGILDRLGPVAEEFAFDMLRAGMKVYFGLKDSRRAPGAARQQWQDADLRARIERLKDTIAQARVEHSHRHTDSTGRRQY